jgi:hypothetical protein
MSVEMRNEVTVNSLLMKSLESATREYARQCVNRLAEEYGFEVEEALKKLNLEKLKLQVQEMKKRSGGKAKAKAKAMKEPEKKEVKTLYPLPFNKENVSSRGCQGLAYNGGLFTQCPKKCMADVRYCKGCQSEIDKNGVPVNGTVEQRLACELMEYRDPKGRKPVRYGKIMEKLKISREQVELEAGKLNILIDEMHFVEEVKEKKVKEKKAILVVKEDDLIAQLMDEYEESETSTVIMSEEEEEEDCSEKDANEKKEAEMLKQADEKALRSEKEAEMAVKKQQQAAKEAEMAQKKQQQADEKAKKEAELAQKKQQQADEKAKKEAELAVKKQQQADEKAKKEAEMAQKKLCGAFSSNCSAGILCK